MTLTLLSRTAPHATVRLIPVSSLGTGFVKMETQVLDDDSGERRTFISTRKRHRPGSPERPIPLNVEIPIACCIPDVLTQRLADLSQSRAEVADEIATTNAAPLTLAQRLGNMRIPVLRELGQWLARTDDQRRQDALSTLRERHSQIRDSESAFRYLVQFSTALRDLFEREYPHSVLKRGKL